jgi:hypothetical protein
VDSFYILVESSVSVTIVDDAINAATIQDTRRGVSEKIGMSFCYSSFIEDGNYKKKVDLGSLQCCLYRLFFVLKNPLNLVLVMECQVRYWTISM